MWHLQPLTYEVPSACNIPFPLTPTFESSAQASLPPDTFLAFSLLSWNLPFQFPLLPLLEYTPTFPSRMLSSQLPSPTLPTWFLTYCFASGIVGWKKEITVCKLQFPFRLLHSNGLGISDRQILWSPCSVLLKVVSKAITTLSTHSHWECETSVFPLENYPKETPPRWQLLARSLWIQDLPLASKMGDKGRQDSACP